MTRFEQVDDKLRILAREMGKIDLFPYIGTQALRVLNNRIFNESRATDGSALPQYKSKYYKKKKKKTSNRWDLQDTLDLRDSIIMRDTKKGTQIVMLNVTSSGGVTQTQKAEGLEDRAGKEIFSYSKQEIKEINDLANKEWMRQFRKVFNKVFA